jgi:maleate cis-trans isomerase
VSKLILKMSMSLDGFVGRRQRRQRIHLLLHVRGRRHRAEAVFIGGNGFRATRAVHHLECRTGRLVLEANQVLPWSVLENAGAPVTVRGFGTLFDDRQPDGNNTEER